MAEGASESRQDANFRAKQDEMRTMMLAREKEAPHSAEDAGSSGPAIAGPPA